MSTAAWGDQQPKSASEEPVCHCDRCTNDRAFLRSSTKPLRVKDKRPLRVVDLFSGCGGMTCGLDEAARRAGRQVKVVLAVDTEEPVTSVFKHNFGGNVLTSDVRDIFDGKVGAALTAAEERTSESIGAVDVLLAGPPCQGHSDLNNKTRRNDPKNALYLSAVRAAEVLRPRVLVIENVPTVVRDKSGVVDTATEKLRAAGYAVHGQTIHLTDVGVPQRRRRYLLVASRIDSFDPLDAFITLRQTWGDHPVRTLRWAIDDLEVTESESVIDRTGTVSKQNRRRIDYLFDNGLFDLPDEERPDCHRFAPHSYKSVYGRLSWDQPAQTITTGFGCMGQGRYVHPRERRTITPHEAARLQGFPDWFWWGDPPRRTWLSTMIGNAVPPLLLASVLGEQIIQALT